MYRKLQNIMAKKYKVKDDDETYEVEEYETENTSVEIDKDEKYFEDVLNIEFDFKNKNEIIKNLTKLSTYIDLWAKSNGNAEYLEAAISKFDAGLAMLGAIDPTNPMCHYFNQKKAERKQKRKWKNIIIACVIGGFVILMICMYAFTDWEAEDAKQAEQWKSIKEFFKGE